MIAIRLHVEGQLDGLKPSHKKALERTFLRRSLPAQMLSLELARHLAALTHTIGRQIGVLIDRRGHITHVFVGDAKRIYLPEIGRTRAGRGHRRGLRHVHTTLGEATLTREDYSDLRQLRLDAVAALGVDAEGNPRGLSWAFVAPAQASPETERVSTPLLGEVAHLHALELDVAATLAGLEEEAGRTAQLQDNTGGERVMLVGVYSQRKDAEGRMAELRELAHTAGLVPVEEVVQLRSRPDHRYVLGRGRLEECVLACLDLGCELLVIDHDLTPAQARAIAALSELRVLDRTQLILDIFAQHAKSRDGKLQVELAQLKYTLPRLTDLDAGLSRLSGGIGGRGPGETKLELGRRRARERIVRLEREIESLREQRSLRRERRRASGQPVVAIVGYTNAGKSTLMARLSATSQLVADQLFATLDTTSRRVSLGGSQQVVLTDTVGFIRDLPPDLMRAFRATLEELGEANLLLHVVDVSDAAREEKMASVEHVLGELELGGIAQLVVLNKADKVEPFVAEALSRRHHGLSVSATNNQGMGALREAIAARLGLG